MSTAAALYLFNRDLSRYGTIVLLVIGTISCSCSLMVFTQETLRQSPCTIYLIAINVLNLVYIFWALIIRTLQFGYNIDPSSTSLVFCRLLYYISVVFSSCESSYLLLASIDRILITSSSATTRQRSTRRAAYLSMALISLFWAIFHTHLFIFIDILHFGPYYTVCFYRPQAYTTQSWRIIPLELMEFSPYHWWLSLDCGQWEMFVDFADQIRLLHKHLLLFQM